MMNEKRFIEKGDPGRGRGGLIQREARERINAT
jgi:hypothetical protein